jgi:hypothetical protein
MWQAAQAEPRFPLRLWEIVTTRHVLFVGRRYHRQCSGVAPVVSKRLDVAVVEQHLPALRALGEDLGESHPGLFRWLPLLLPLLPIHTPRQAEFSRDGRLEVFWLRGYAEAVR